VTRVQRPEGSPEEGSLALFLAVVVTAAFIMAGLVLDVGGALNSRERAADIAGQAARAGANALTGSSLRTGTGTLAVGSAGAKSAAQQVINLSGPGAVTGGVTVTGNTVSVKVTVTHAAAILSLIGVHDLSQTATATATGVYGGTTQEGG
jgi:Flp pilus assembly protein TadG